MPVNNVITAFKHIKATCPHSPRTNNHVECWHKIIQGYVRKNLSLEKGPIIIRFILKFIIIPF